MSIIIHFDRYKWEKIGKTNCFEKIFNGKIWNQELIDGLDVISKESFIDLVKQLDGFFSLVFKSERKLFVAVDHIRSYPIFYSEYNNNLYLSDNAEWVREQVKDEIMDPVAQQEFQLLGYVTQANTLYPNVKQLQAGELLTYDIEKGLNLYQYYEFTHKEPLKFDIPEQLYKLDIVARKSMQKLVDFANGRQIVVPLSGGYDSRLIILLLKEVDYKNVVAFSYGLKGNKEAHYSEYIANALGIKWIFVEYTKQKYRKFWDTRELKEYLNFGSSNASLPHTQDLIAVKNLKENELIDDDAIFVPGHCCVTGFLSDIREKPINRKKLLEDLSGIHSLYFLKENETKKLENIYGVGVKDFTTIDEYVLYFMKFGWKERQSKYICNSVRVYEYYDFQWYMPLWDKNFSNYWVSIPFTQRLGRKFYINYVLELQKKYLEKPLNNAAQKPSLLRFIKRVLSSFIHIDTLKKLHNHYFVKPDYRLSRYPNNEVNKLIKEGYSANGISAFYFLLHINKKGK